MYVGESHRHLSLSQVRNRHQRSASRSPRFRPMWRLLARRSTRSWQHRPGLRASARGLRPLLPQTTATATATAAKFTRQAARSPLGANPRRRQLPRGALRALRSRRSRSRKTSGHVRSPLSLRPYLPLATPSIRERRATSRTTSRSRFPTPTYLNFALFIQHKSQSRTPEPPSAPPQASLARSKSRA